MEKLYKKELGIGDKIGTGNSENKLKYLFNPVILKRSWKVVVISMGP